MPNTKSTDERVVDLEQKVEEIIKQHNLLADDFKKLVSAVRKSQPQTRTLLDQS